MNYNVGSPKISSIHVHTSNINLMYIMADRNKKGPKAQRISTGSEDLGPSSFVINFRIRTGGPKVQFSGI